MKQPAPPSGSTDHLREIVALVLTQIALLKSSDQIALFLVSYSLAKIALLCEFLGTGKGADVNRPIRLLRAVVATP